MEDCVFQLKLTEEELSLGNMIFQNSSLEIYIEST